MIYVFMAFAALLAIAYIIYLVLDLLGRRKLAERYSTWEPDLDQYYRKQPADRDEQDKNERICELLEDLCRMQGQR